MSDPLVSVCIGAYNREDYIQECIDSVLAQTYTNLEIVIVDDASTDRTLELLESYGDKIRLIRRSTNSGVCSITRNEACQAATGTYIALLDSDDKWYPEKVAKQVAFMEAHPEIPLCHPYCEVINDASEVVCVRHQDAIPPTGPYFDHLLKHCWITISMVMFRPEIFERVGGGFKAEAPFGYLGEDYEFFLRVAKIADIGFIPEVLGGYRKSDQNITFGNWRALPESVPFYQAILNKTTIWEGKLTRTQMADVVYEHCRTNFHHWRYQRDWIKAFYFVIQGLRCRPSLKKVFSI